MVSTRIRTVPKNRNSIKQALKNNKEKTKRWIYGVKPKCIKHEWCQGNEHYQTPMSMMDGPAGKLGKMNADTILIPGKEQLKKNMYTAVIDFMNTLRKIKGHTKEYQYTRKGLQKTMADLNIDRYSANDLIQKLHTLQEKWQKDETHQTLQTQNTKHLTNWDIQKAKRQLEGLIVTELDKNKAKLYVECPMAHYHRLKRAFYDIPNYRRIFMRNSDEILKDMKKNFHQQQLYKFAPWNNKGTLPVGFAHPKEKDPFNKERGIASYFKHPMRKLYRRTNKVLTWLFRQLPKSCPHFTLHKLHNLKHRVAEAQTTMREIYGENTEKNIFCTDVQQMFTNLTHDGIKKATRWMLDTLKDQKQYTTRGGIPRTPRKFRKNKVTLVTETDEVYWGQSTHEAQHKERATGSKEDIIIFNFDDLMQIIHFDLNTTYSTVGKTILEQKHGCPIGGILSCFYANIYCAWREYIFMKKHEENGKHRIYGIRQVDDLIMWVSYEKGNKHSEKQADNIIKELLNTDTKASEVYKDGLTLTEEEITTKIQKGKRTFRTEFAGTIIKGEMTAENFTTQTLNKNWYTIRLLNKQRFPKLPHYTSYIHSRVKKAVITGMMIRLDTQNSNEKLFKKHFARSILELRSISYTESFISNALSTLHKRPSWRNRILWMKKLITAIFKRQTPQ